MKLKSYLLSMLTIGVFFSCSPNDSLTEESSVEPDAYLSLAINQDYKVSTKAGVTDGQDDKLDNLAVAVFNNGAYEDAYPIGTLVAYQTLKRTEDIKSVTDTVKNIPVKGGPLQVLVLANTTFLSDFTPNIGTTTLDQFLAAKADLSNETPGKLSMSSAVLSIIASPNIHNYLGFTETYAVDVMNGYHVTPTSQEITTDGVKIYRNVSRIQLTNLTLSNKTTEWGTPVSLKVDSIFIANAKKTSKIASSAGWGAVETATTATNWYDGAEGDVIGALKSHTSSPDVAWLCQPYTAETIIQAGEAITPNYFFYVYENNWVDKTASNDNTLLMIRGDFTYIPAGGTTPTTKYDCYYAVTVNRPYEGKNNSSFEGVVFHDYIKRNVKYNINVTLQGPGSKEPFDPEAEACLAAKVMATPWNVINIDVPNLD